MIEGILDSIKYVVENSRHVKINEINLEEFCHKLENASFVHWLEKSPCLLTLPKDQYLNFLFILNSISFCYWPAPKWAIIEHGTKIDGAWGMICTLMRAIRNGCPLTDFEYLNQISFDTFKNLFYSPEGELALLEERYDILKFLAGKMLNTFQGNPSLLIKQCNRDVNTLLEMLVFYFPYFNDYSKFHTRKIFFFKKAQLLISDIDFLLKDDPNNTFIQNVGQITACADYKIPYVFRNLKIFEYSRDLDEMINTETLLPSDSIEEIEIRAHTIWAIELMKNYLEKIGIKILSTQLNDYLWLMSQQKNIFKIPYHRTITTKY